MPTASEVSPSAEASVTTTSTRYLRRVKVCNGTTRSGAGVDSRARCVGSLYLAVGHNLVALGTKLEKRLCFHIEPLHVSIDDSFAHNAPCSLGPEIILVVETVDHFQHVVLRQAWILNVCQLVAAFVHHRPIVDDEAVFSSEIVELGAGVCVRNRYLDGFHIQSLGKVDCVADRLLGFAGQAEDKVTMDGEAKLMALAGEVTRALHGCTLLDV